MTEKFTFHNGRVVEIKRVSPLLIQELDRSFPRPLPPMTPNDYGDGIVKEEPNYSDPGYRDSIRQWQIDRDKRWIKLLFHRGIVCDVDRKEVRLLREDMLSLGVELEKDDQIVYIAYICIGSPDESDRLIQAIRGISQPSEEGIATAAESFRDNSQES